LKEGVILSYNHLRNLDIMVYANED
jgi:hypothetical protein